MGKRYVKRKGKGGERNPDKKWKDLRPDQRAWALESAADTYRRSRQALGRALNKQERHSLVKAVKLRIWIPVAEVRSYFLNVFAAEEQRIAAKEKTT